MARGTGPGTHARESQRLTEGISLQTLRTTPRYAYLVAVVAAVGGLLFGYDIGVISGAEIFLKHAFHMSASSEELAVSAVLIGGIIGGLIGGRLANAISRRRALMVMAVIYGVGAILTSISPSYWFFFGFRVLVGVAVGASSMIVPMYIAELSPTKIRGGLTLLQQLFISGGILVSYLIDYGFAAAGWGWQPMFAVAVIPAAILGTGMLFLDYSPRWLAMRGRWQEAERVMGRINPGTRDEEMEMLRKDMEERERTSGWELLRPGLRGALIAGIGLGIFQQFTGPNTVLYYTPTIFKDAGVAATSNALVSTIYVGAVLFVFVFPAIGLVDWLGRRTLFYIGLSGMAAMLGALGVVFHFGAAAFGPEVLAILLIYVAFYSLSISPLTWLMSAELFPNRLRGAGGSATSVSVFAANFVIAETFLSELKLIGTPVTFWIYAFIAVLAIVFVRLVIPETKGRPLENIEWYWTHGRRWR